jgi:hypothetical protein
MSTPRTSDAVSGCTVESFRPSLKAAMASARVGCEPLNAGKLAEAAGGFDPDPDPPVSSHLTCLRHWLTTFATGLKSVQVPNA